MIHLSHIYCKHWLKDKKLKHVLDACAHDIFYIDPHYALHIEDTIHYKSLISNNFNTYKQLIATTKQREHSVHKYKKLIENFDVNTMDKIKVHYIKKQNKYMVHDGVHRFAVLLFKKIIHEAMPLEFLDIEYDNHTIDFIQQKLSDTTNQTYSNGWNNKRTSFGYHSFNINNINIKGQRQPIVRLNELKKVINFNNKVVIDFGCNTGGMLLHLPEIKEGYGVDYSTHCIEAANAIKHVLNYNNKTKFMVKDLNGFNFTAFLKQHDLMKKVDIIFLLSLGSWIKDWRNLYKNAYHHANQIILETNNDKEGIPQIKLFKRLGANIVLIIEKSLDDTTKNHGRKTYLIKKK